MEDQLSFDFTVRGRMKPKKDAQARPKRRGVVTNRRCLKCDKQHRSRWPGICHKCKRHVDYKSGDQEDDYTVAL